MMCCTVYQEIFDVVAQQKHAPTIFSYSFIYCSIKYVAKGCKKNIIMIRCKTNNNIIIIIIIMSRCRKTHMKLVVTACTAQSYTHAVSHPLHLVLVLHRSHHTHTPTSTCTHTYLHMYTHLPPHTLSHTHTNSTPISCRGQSHPQLAPD